MVLAPGRQGPNLKRSSARQDGFPAGEEDTYRRGVRVSGSTGRGSHARSAGMVEENVAGIETRAEVRCPVLPWPGSGERRTSQVGGGGRICTGKEDMAVQAGAANPIHSAPEADPRAFRSPGTPLCSGGPGLISTPGRRFTARCSPSAAPGIKLGANPSSSTPSRRLKHSTCQWPTGRATRPPLFIPSRLHADFSIPSALLPPPLCL
jgi:hypothetical protein